MLILAQKGRPTGGFFLKHKAKRGKLPPVIRGIYLGNHPCVLLTLYGEVTPGNRFLAPYLRRGDTVILSGELEGKFHWNRPYVEELTRRQCVNFVKQRLIHSPKDTQTVLYDPQGDCMGVAAELCEGGGTLWVITHQPQGYAPCLEYTTLMFGNPFVLTEITPSEGDLVIAPYGVGEQPLPQEATVFAPDRGRWIKEKELELPQKIKHTTPDGFDPVATTAGCMAMFGGEYLDLTPQGTGKEAEKGEKDKQKPQSTLDGYFGVSNLKR